MQKQFIICLSMLCTIVIQAQSSNAIVGADYFGDLKARHIGPALMSGRVSDVEQHPTNSNIVYIGSAGGGVWKSNDGGVKFNPIFDK